MCDSILKLKLSLEEKTPALLLGAGFSYGANAYKIIFYKVLK